MQPIISIVIPSYNQAHFLTRAIQSLVDQTYQNWEAIIVDNHSEDSSVEVAAGFNDSRIRIFSIHNYGVIATSRNKGIDESTGEWIALLDSDDWWIPEKLQDCVNVMSENVDLIYHDLKIKRETPSFFERDNVESRQLTKPVLIDLLVNDNAISNSSVIVRKSLLTQIGKLNESPEMAGAEDYNAWLRIAQITDKFLYIPEFLGFYQVHAKGVSRKDMTVCYRNAIKEFLPLLNQQQKSKIEATMFYMRGKHHYQNKRPAQARKELKAVFKTGGAGLQVKAICVYGLTFFMKNAK